MPKPMPINSAPANSMTGPTIAIPTSRGELPIPSCSRVVAAEAMPKATSATASSSATTASNVSVKGPLARYWRATMMMEIGAVAAAIAASITAQSAG